MADLDDQKSEVPSQVSDQEWLQNYLSEHQGNVGPGTQISSPLKKKSGSALPLILAVALVIAVASAALMMARNGSLRPTSKKENPGDLGQGVSIDAGLRGHLVTELQDKTVHYKLKMEPIALPEQDAFGREVAANKAVLYFNLRVLDAVGDPVCGKQVVLPPVGSNAAPAGADAFQRVKSTRGTIDGLWVEGTLPCSPDQFARFSYWDFTSNFPSVDDQDRTFGIDHRAQTESSEQQEPAAQAQSSPTAQTKTTTSGARRRAAKKQKPQVGFYLQGDDHISAFEPGRNILTVGPGRSFVVLRATDLATASAWADDAALVHYICDQQAYCTLKRSGSAATIVARRIN